MKKKIVVFVAVLVLLRMFSVMAGQSRMLRESFRMRWRLGLSRGYPRDS